MDPVKRFRIVFWITFVVLVLVIAAGSYYFLNLNNWKEEVIAGKDQKIALQTNDLAKQAKLLEDASLQTIKNASSQTAKDTSSQTAKDKEALAAENTQLTTENTQLKKDKESLTAENNSLKTGREKALAYNEVFKYINTIIETHNGFDGWTDAEFQAGRTLAEATGNTTYVSTINWCWYDHSVAQLTRALRFWKETATNIETSLK